MYDDRHMKILAKDSLVPCEYCGKDGKNYVVQISSDIP